MKYPVIDDWNGTDWRCVTIDWPDSPLWIGLLSGLLTMANRGRFWDERTGSITDMQEIARAIYDANFPLRDCAGETIPEESASSALDGLGELLMTNCSIPYGSIKWIGGVLYYRYCGEWYAVEGDSGGGEIPSSGEEGYSDYPAAGYDDPTPCSQATVISDIMFSIVDTFLDMATPDPDPAIPLVALNQVKDNFPHIDFGEAALLSAYLSAVYIAAVGLASETEGALAQQTIKCRMSQAATSAPAGWDETTRSNVQQAIASATAQWFDFATYATVEGEMDNIYLMSYRSIGATDTYNLTATAYPTGLEDCSCPGLGAGDEMPEWINDGDWYVILDFQGNLPWGAVLNTYGYGTQITAQGAQLTDGWTGTDNMGITDWTPPDVTGTVTRVKLECLISDLWLADDTWGLTGFQIGGIGNNLQSELIGTSGVYVYENIVDSFLVSEFMFNFEGNYEDNRSPEFPIVARVILAGTGNHPFGL